MYCFGNQQLSGFIFGMMVIHERCNLGWGQRNLGIARNEEFLKLCLAQNSGESILNTGYDFRVAAVVPERSA